MDTILIPFHRLFYPKLGRTQKRTLERLLVRPITTCGYLGPASHHVCLSGAHPWLRSLDIRSIKTILIIRYQLRRRRGSGPMRREIGPSRGADRAKKMENSGRTKKKKKYAQPSSSYSGGYREAMISSDFVGSQVGLQPRSPELRILATQSETFWNN